MKSAPHQGVASKLTNLSTCAFVSTDDNTVIAGFLLSNNAWDDDRILVRNIGPSLVPGSFSTSAVPADQRLELRYTNGTLLVANNYREDGPV